VNRLVPLTNSPPPKRLQDGRRLPLVGSVALRKHLESNIPWELRRPMCAAFTWPPLHRVRGRGADSLSSQRTLRPGLVVASAVLGDRLSRCLRAAVHEPYVGIFLDVGTQPVRMALTHGQHRVVPVNQKSDRRHGLMGALRDGAGLASTCHKTQLPRTALSPA
jgi:hypothetical protein